MQVDAFILQRPPEAFDEDSVQIPGFAVNRYFGFGPLQPVGPVKGRKLAALISIHEMGCTNLVDSLVLGLKASRQKPTSSVFKMR